MIHFTNGDSVRNTLIDAGVVGDIEICADILHEGPCPEGLSPQEFDDVRARYLAEGDYASLAEVRSAFAARAEVIERAAREDEVVLWFEHDLFDQLNLIWLLDRFRHAGVAPERVRLIVIGEFPGVVPFHGLGQLTAEQLKALFPTRVPLRSEQADYGTAVWKAVCEPTPEGIWPAAGGSSKSDGVNQTPLEFVPAALKRLLEELPGTEDGLSRTERQGLAAVAAGATTLEDAFQVQSLQEQAVFLGDSSFFGAMQRLANAEVPLLRIGEDVQPGLQTCEPTEHGILVLAGDEDHAALNGLDRWVGGTHLTGRTPRWRWNPERGGLVSR